jgi:hypothetical protein
MPAQRFMAACLLIIPAVLSGASCSRAQSQSLPAVEMTDYPWLAEWPGELPPMTSLDTYLQTPAGLTRVEVTPDSFAAWLRSLPVREDRDHVLSFRGRQVASPSAAVAVVDLGRGDLQQCADSLLRLHAEYLWATGRAALAEYHFTSGHLSSWAAWVRGERVRVSGSQVETFSGSPRSSTHESFRAWLQQLFIYAGTMSLELDSQPVASLGAVAAGDFFVLPGSPGHTVMVLDVAIDPNGKRFGLIGQGYTPAQDFHVIASSFTEVIGQVWFPLPEGESETLHVPTWQPFPRSSARRFSSIEPPSE